MEAIEHLATIDFVTLTIQIFIVIAGFKAGSHLLGWLKEKLGLETKWEREKKKEHELLIQTSNNVIALQEKHEQDMKNSNLLDEKIQRQLSEFMNEMKLSMSQTQTEIKQIVENRIHDREQSFGIQKELTNAIKSVTDGEKERDIQIEALMCGNKELLGAEIDKRYREYVALDGIPECDVDEFDDIFAAYKRLKGNHRRDTKYNYVKNHLKVIPTETKLITNKE